MSFDHKEFARHAMENIKMWLLEQLDPVREALKSTQDQVLRLDERTKVAVAAKDGRDGRDGPTAAELLPYIAETIKTLLPPAPPPGEDGVNGADGKDGVNGADGKDGVSVSVEEVVAKLLPAINERSELAIAKLLADTERRAQDAVREAVKALPQPKDGRDGADGIGFDDFAVEFDGERTIKLLFTSGAVTKETAPIRLPVPIHRGIFDPLRKYELGDEVTYGGSVWRAVKELPPGKPGDGGEEATGWRLVAKRGRDGRDAAPQKV